MNKKVFLILLMMIMLCSIVLVSCGEKDCTVTWVNGDETTTSLVKYGTVPTAPKASKKADQQYTYSNGDWGKIEAVTEDVTYTAKFSVTLNIYTVTWVNGDKNITTQVEYGSKATEPDGIILEDYAFEGWFLGDKKYDFDTVVTGKITLNASFKQPTEGLEYTLNDDETGYIVSDIGTATDIEILIAKYYEGKPVISIGESAFMGCASLTSVMIPDSVTSIGDSAFMGCASLTSIIIPDSVTNINGFAFESCVKLTSVEIPDSVTNIGSLAFANCGNLASIEVDIDNENYKSIDGNLYDKDVLALLQYAIGKKATEFIIPNSVTTIREYAFFGCTNLTSIVISNSVTGIRWYVFSGCTNLTSVVIPDSVTSIGNFAFFDCDELTIYAEAESKPSGWYYEWNDSNCPVVWGYKNI